MQRLCKSRAESSSLLECYAEPPPILCKDIFFPSHRQISWILLTKRYSHTDDYLKPHGSHRFHGFPSGSLDYSSAELKRNLNRLQTMFFLFIAVYIFQAVGSENIYGVFNVFVKKSVSICEYLWENKYTIRMVNPCLSVSIRVPKHTHPHGKSVFVCYLWENKEILRMAPLRLNSV